MQPTHQGDVLDRALQVARAKAPAHVAANPALTPDQKGFFGAVAGARSPINRQSSRVAKPFADNPFLGGGNVGTVATPEQQAFLSLGAAKKGNPQAKTIEQNYVKAADTRKVVPGKPTASRTGGAGVRGTALTAPSDLAIGQRALGLIGNNVPLGSAVEPAIRALQHLGLNPDQKQQVIQGFARDPTLQRPGAQADLVAAAVARGNSLPAHPNTQQLLTAAITDEHKPSYWDALTNLPKDALFTPVYAAEGGYALGHASREALPASLGGQGDLSGLKAIGNSQLQQVEHPGAFVQQHPFQAALAAIGAAKGVGGLAGKIAKLPETSRDVTLSNYPLSPINRGTLDQNLTVRAAQKVSDKLLANGPEAVQSNALKNRVQSANTQIVRDRGLQDRKDFSEYADARKGIPRRRQMALLQNEAQGLTAPEREAFYKNLGETPARSGQANLAAAQAKKFDAPLNEKEQRFLTAARGVAQKRTQDLVDSGRLAPEDALRRDYQPLAHVRAQQGDATASHLIDLETEIRSLSDEMATKPAQRDALQPLVDQANREHSATLQKFVSEQQAQGADPFRVPMVRPKVKSEFNTPGQPVRANANLPISGLGKPRSYGDQFRSGNFTQTPEAFNRQLLEVHTAQDAKAFVQHVVNPENGLSTPVANGQALPDAVRENYVLRNTDNLRTKPKNADKSVDSAEFSNSEAHALSTIKNLDEGWVTDPNELLRVPDQGNFVLVPKPVYEQITQTVARVRPGSGAAKLQQATRAFKTGVLMTRPTYPLSNLMQGVGQGALVGTGPLSWTRAIRDSLPTIAGTEDAGFVAREFGHNAGQTARSFLDEGRPIRALAQATVGNYVKGIRNASIAVDNAARKATANKLMVGEAKKLAGYGKFHRTFSRVNDELVDLMQKMADGDTPETRAAADRVIQGLNEVQGDYGAMRSNAALDFAVPFHRWTRYISQLTLKTLPLKYPGRTLGIYQLGDLGQQGAAQKGVLPQYLAEPLDLAGSATNRLTGSAARINSLASLGTTFEPDANGNPSLSGAISQLSPYASIGYGALTGKNLETGNALLNGQGKPITSLEDRARFLGNQATGFIPPLGALAGGAAGKPATTIPLPGLNQNLPASKTKAPRPTGPTIDIPFIGKVPIIPLVNQFSPIRFDVRNETADQAAAFKKFASQLRSQFKSEIQAKAKNMTPDEVKQLEAKYQKIGAEAQRNQAYYAKNPKALAALLASGTGTR